MNPPRIAAIILAAGASRRLGHPKQLVQLGPETLLERAVRVAQQAGCDPVLVVLGADADLIQARCDLHATHVLINDHWPEGMATSIHAALAVLSSAVLSPDALPPAVLSPDALPPAVLSPDALPPAVLSPDALASTALPSSPPQKTLSFRPERSAVEKPASAPAQAEGSTQESETRPLSGAIFMVCDQPAITPQHLHALTAMGHLTASMYDGRNGVPAYFPASLFPQLAQLTGDSGARDLLRSAPAIPLRNGELDVDTPVELEIARDLYGK